MFWFFRWLFISIAAIVVALGLAFGFKQLQNKYYPAYQMNEFADNDYTGNAGTLPDAVTGGVALLKAKNYRAFLKSYIPEEGRNMYEQRGRSIDDFVQDFKTGKASTLLAALTECADIGDYALDGNSGTCKISNPIRGKNTMTFIREKGTWRLEN